MTNVIEATEAFGRPKAKAHTGYRLVIEPSSQRIHAVFNGEIVADSRRALVMSETRLRPVYYFPREDVRLDLLAPTDHLTHCPFKGDANYWTLSAGGETAENAIWSYEAPFDEMLPIKDHIAFYWDRMDSWTADGMAVSEAA